MNEPQETHDSPPASLGTCLRELAALFLKLGAISFGGPAAHIALMEAEVVRKRQWVTQQQFLDMLGAANLIPGPTSTELAINLGFVRAGWSGLCVAGVSFIIPAALITGIFAWAYLRFGALTPAVSLLGGTKAAVIAVIAIAIWRLGKTAMKDAGLASTRRVIASSIFVWPESDCNSFRRRAAGYVGATHDEASRLWRSTPFADAPAQSLSWKLNCSNLCIPVRIGHRR